MLIDVFDYRETEIRELVFSRCPIVVCASLIARDMVALFRNGEPFVSVGIEHGFSPFKSYTFGEHFLRHDIYFAPSSLWADRLSRLYSPPLGKIVVGGYPRAHEMDELLRRSASQRFDTLDVRYWRGVPRSRRKLVIFSWGVNPEELSSLPDSSEIVYLLHPADERLFSGSSFKLASLVVSSPELTALLLANAGLILGDFSSLTFEAVYFGLAPFFFICRNLYLSDCDMTEEFFRRGSSKFANIPHTDHQIDPGAILDFDSFLALLGRKSDDLSDLRVRPLQLPNGFLPPSEFNSRSFIAEGILALAKKAGEPGDYAEDQARRSRIDAIMVLADGYRKILKRKPDGPGISHYLPKLTSRELTINERVAKFNAALANSPESQQKNGAHACGLERGTSHK